MHRKSLRQSTFSFEKVRLLTSPLHWLDISDQNSILHPYTTVQQQIKVRILIKRSYFLFHICLKIFEALFKVLLTSPFQCSNNINQFGEIIWKFFSWKSLQTTYIMRQFSSLLGLFWNYKLWIEIINNNTCNNTCFTFALTALSANVWMHMLRTTRSKIAVQRKIWKVSFPRITICYANNCLSQLTWTRLTWDPKKKWENICYAFQFCSCRS